MPGEVVEVPINQLSDPSESLPEAVRVTSDLLQARAV